MTRPEWLEACARIRAYWPHKAIPDTSIALWYEDLKHLPAEQVTTSIAALYRDGREFPPNGAQILAKANELDCEDIDHGEAWRLVYDALAKHLPNWSAFYEALPPAVAEAARRYGFESQNGYLKSEEGTVRAQFREIYKNVVRTQRRDAAYIGLPSAGFRTLTQPRKFSARKALQRGPSA